MSALATSTKNKLLTLACQILHTPSKLKELTVEQLLDITKELEDIKISILADVCKHERNSN